MTRTTLLTLLLVIAAGAVRAEDTAMGQGVIPIWIKVWPPDPSCEPEGTIITISDSLGHVLSQHMIGRGGRGVQVFVDPSPQIPPDSTRPFEIRRMIDSAVAEEVGKRMEAVGEWRMTITHPQEGCDGQDTLLVYWVHPAPCTTWTWIRTEGE